MLLNNSEWLKNMIQCGKISIEIVNQDKKTGQVSFNTTSPDSDTYVSYTTTTTIDKSALAKAEAEYEHKTKQMTRKIKNSIWIYLSSKLKEPLLLQNTNPLKK